MSSRATRLEVADTAVTPLASIFGSGFLIIVPVVVAATGAAAPWWIVAVSLFAMLVGTSVRACVKRVEGRSRRELGRFTATADAIASPAIAVAYVVSVALYLRVLAANAYAVFDANSAVTERITVTIIVAAIAAVGMAGGFQRLELIERYILAATLVLLVVLVGALMVYDITHFDVVRSTMLQAPSKPSWHTLAVLGGVLITVQGFETIRFLGRQRSADARLRASWWSQILATVIYAALAVSVAPLIVSLGVEPDGRALLELVRQVLPVFTFPLLFIALGSQLSAAIADAATSVEIGSSVSWIPGGERIQYLVVAALVAVLAWAFGTYQLVALASRAFAVYYALTSAAAAGSSPRLLPRIGHGALAVVLLAIAVFAKPAG